MVRGVGNEQILSPLGAGQAGPLDQRTVSMSWISSHRMPSPVREKRTAFPGSTPLAMT